jgi:hypothetical protein
MQSDREGVEMGIETCLIALSPSECFLADVCMYDLTSRAFVMLITQPRKFANALRKGLDSSRSDIGAEKVARSIPSIA